MLTYDPIGDDGIFLALFTGNINTPEGKFMRFLKDLIEKYSDVWIYCADKNLQRLFLIQADSEGFRALNGEKPADMRCQKLYGISSDYSVGYLSSMVWSMTKGTGDRHVRIDYGKFIKGADARMDLCDRQVWKKLFDGHGVLKYEGMTVNGEPHGAGTLYYPSGCIYKEGVFGGKGLLCGTEYYPNGNKRFTGSYRYNSGNGPNYPVYGTFFHKDGSLGYEGNIMVHRSGSGWPSVDYPVDYGPVEQEGIPDMEFFDFCIEIDDGSGE